MIGRRVHPNADGELWLHDSDYGYDPQRQVWYARPPGCHTGSLRAHEVTQHEDGTITASPSILIHPHGSDGRQCPGWHGYLERGVWRKV